MSKEIIYTDEPLEFGEEVRDFLPPPSELVLKEEQVKVTLSLSKNSIEFFKEQAKKHGTAYQPMIRELLDSYAKQYQPSSS